MSATRADLRARLTEFAATADATVDLALADALSQINATNWGETKSFLGQIYLAGHLLSLWSLASGAPGGPVSSRRDGDLAESYAIGSSLASDVLASTPYGRMYVDLRSSVFSVRVL